MHLTLKHLRKCSVRPGLASSRMRLGGRRWPREIGSWRNSNGGEIDDRGGSRGHSGRSHLGR